MAHDRVRFRVGEQVFFTSRATIANGGRNSMLAAMIDSLWQRPTVGDSVPDADELFIDRNPTYFSVLLDLLRTGELHIPPGMSEAALFQEALYYGVLDQVRAARWGPLDGNRLARTASVSGCAIGEGRPAIRASGDGGCCVARGGMVHVYDWTLEEQAPLTLDYIRIYDMAYLGTQRVLISADAQDVNQRAGGLAAFDVCSGDVVHRYKAQRFENQGYKASAVATGEGDHVFASCSYGLTGGIGTWDQTTGQQVQFFSDNVLGVGLQICNKLQWLPGSKLLLVACLSDMGFWFRLLDMRTNKEVWSWGSQGGTGALAGFPDVEGDKRVVDFVAMDDCSTLCVASKELLGVFDVRVTQPSWVLHWSELGPPYYYAPRLAHSEPEHVFRTWPKLACWGSQLFASMLDNIYVRCNPYWESKRGHSSTHTLTSVLRNAGSRGIADMSVGGDRLFVLHNREDVFDVWETPLKKSSCTVHKMSTR